MARFAYSADMEFAYEDRLRRLRVAMIERGVGAVLLSVGPELPYFTGYEAFPTERLTMAAITDSEAVIFVPRLEAPKVPKGPLPVRAWDEVEDPIELITRLVGTPDRVAIGEQTWSAFTLALQGALRCSEWIGAGELIRELRIRKDEYEIQALATAASHADSVAARLAREVRFAGSSEAEISARIREILVEEGHDRALFSIVASGPNGASPHHDPTSRVIQPGDLVICDFGGSVWGYRSDTTRTFSVGEPTPKQAEVHQVVAVAQQAAIDAVRAGVACQEIDRAARSVIEDAGYGDYFIHRTGHGIGLDVHEEPYLVEGNERLLEEGMAFSVEPGIYISGEFGVRIEDIVICGSSEGRVLNQSPRALVVVN